MLGQGWRKRMRGEGSGRRIVGVVAVEIVRALHVLEKPWLSTRNQNAEEREQYQKSLTSSAIESQCRDSPR